MIGASKGCTLTEVYKIFAWREGSYWRGQDLISVSQMRSMLHVLNWKKEVFASIQDYDEFGNCISSRLVFDFDGDPDTVLKDVKHFIQACEFVVNVTPRIYFSGNKGFHLTIDHMIEHPLCHLLNQDFADEIACVTTLDKKIYRVNSLFRIPGSPASKKGYFKIQLSRYELFSLRYEEIQDLARDRRVYEDDHDATCIEHDVMQAWLKVALRKLPDFTSLDHVLAHTHSVGMEMTPCIHTLLTQRQPQGNRHESLFILARFFKLCGLDVDNTRRALEVHPHWNEYEQTDGEITKVLKSVFYTRKQTMLGCKSNSVSAEIMRDNCQDVCPFNANFPKIAVEDLKGQIHHV